MIQELLAHTMPPASNDAAAPAHRSPNRASEGGPDGGPDGGVRAISRLSGAAREAFLDDMPLRDTMIRGMAALADVMPGAQFVAADPELMIIGCSARWASGHGFQPASLAGRSLRGFEQSAVAEERRAILKSVIESRATAVVRSIRHGMHEVAVMMPIEIGGRCHGAAWLTQPGTGCAQATDGVQVVYPLHHQWGSIGQATNRQLDVLRLLGRALDNHSIAEQLKNGKRTVEWHVSVLMEVLGVADRSELVRLSSCAGLPFFPDEAWARMLRNRDRNTAASRRSPAAV